MFPISLKMMHFFPKNISVDKTAINTPKKKKKEKKNLIVT